MEKLYFSEILTCECNRYIESFKFFLNIENARTCDVLYVSSPLSIGITIGRYPSRYHVNDMENRIYWLASLGDAFLHWGNRDVVGACKLQVGAPLVTKRVRSTTRLFGFSSIIRDELMEERPHVLIPNYPLKLVLQSQTVASSMITTIMKLTKLGNIFYFECF